MAEQISIKDRLPDIMVENNNVKVTDTVIASDGEIVYFGNFKIYIYDNSFVFAGVNEDSIDEYGGDFICVTHWMPLPEPPKPEGNRNGLSGN